MEPTRPLVSDGAYKACRSAFSDPRFPPLSESELDILEISVSVPSPLEARPVNSERSLLAALRRKAGLPAGHWSPAVRFERHTVTDAS